MAISGNFKLLGIYLVITLIVVFGFYFLLKLYYQHNYSQEEVEKLLSSASSSKYYNGNPCTTAIYGDPVDAGTNYVKVNLHCNDKETTANTIDLRVIKNQTQKEALVFLGNVNGFRTEVSDNEVESLGDLKTSDGKGWRCFIGTDRQITDFNSPLEAQQTINCFYNFEDLAIQKYHETH